MKMRATEFIILNQRITDEQWKTIKKIEHFGIAKFNGSSKDDAINFISNHIDELRSTVEDLFWEGLLRKEKSGEWYWKD